MTFIHKFHIHKEKNTFANTHTHTHTHTYAQTKTNKKKKSHGSELSEQNIYVRGRVKIRIMKKKKTEITYALSVVRVA